MGQTRHSPLQKHLENIPKQDWDKDYDNLVNLVQRHTQCSTAYCLRKKNEDDNYSCRFNYPKDCCDKTHLEYEKIHSKDSKLHYKVKVVTKRNDNRLNNHQRLQLQGWRANCDIQVIIDYHSCLEYIAKYASKGEKMSSVAKEVFTSVLHEASHDSDNKNVIKIMMRAVGQRDMGIQEVMHQLLSIKLVSSSFQVVSASLESSRKIMVKGNSLDTEPSLVDMYAKRNLCESDFPGISDLNFVQFASSFCKGKTGIAKRNASVVIKTYPNYSSNPKGPSYGLFCKYQLLKYKPWLCSFNNAWENQEDCDSVYIETWQTFLNTPQAKILVPDWSVQLDTMSEYMNDEHLSDEECQNESGEREEWMYLAELKSKTDLNYHQNNLELPESYWENDRLKYTSQQVGDMAHWINTQKKSYTRETTSSESSVDINSLNNAQWTAYDIVKQHFSNEDENQLLMIIMGLAGSGKSYVIDALKCLLKETCRVCAFFGIAAYNVGGNTLHTLLQLPIRGKRNGPLKSSALSRLQDNLNGVRYLIIDEFSVVGQKMFAWINRRCKEATGKTTIPFGGLSVILVGDIAQLPPITDQVLYHNKPKSDMAIEGYCMYRKFETVVKLEKNLQERARNGDSTLEDWNLLLSRSPSKIQHLEHFKNNAVRLSFGNEKVAQDNYSKLKQLNQPIIQIDAQHNNSKAKHLSADDMGGLEPTIYLAKNARVMLTRNLWTEVGLCNGAMGTVVDVIYAEGCTPPVLPIAIIVQFDKKDYSGPSFCDNIPNCVPLYPVTNSSDVLGTKFERQQFPLRLAWSITIHKAQGLTLNDVWVDLGPSEKVAGLTYVALTRVRRISNLVIEPMSYDRLLCLKKNSNYKYRLLEETRLNNLHQKTISRVQNKFHYH